MEYPKIMTRKLTLLSTAFAVIAITCAALITIQVQTQAQEVTTFVSNVSEASGAPIFRSNGVHAQSFETGANPDGYTITEVQILLGDFALGAITTALKITEDNSGEPGNDVATFTNPSPIKHQELNTFTAPANTTLDPDTTYWIVVNDGVPNADTWEYSNTAANGETGETGWTIGNGRLHRGTESTWSSSDSSLIIAIKGTSTYPNLSIADASATEGDDIVFTVNLSSTSSDDVTFDYATSIESDDNSETGDFTATSGTGTITAGNSATTITVPTTDDGTNEATSVYERDETFTVTISNPTRAGIAQATAKGTIINDENVPTVRFVPNDRSASENAQVITNFLQFAVDPRGEQHSQISLSVTGTATENDDYTIALNTLSIPENSTAVGTSITMVQNDIAEQDETVIITVVAQSGDVQVDPENSTRTLTIIDDDEHPTVGFAAEGYDVSEDDGNAVLTVNRTGQSSFPVHVQYLTASRDNATPGTDYVATSGNLTFQTNETTKTISVPIIDNDTYQTSTKRFDVDLAHSPLSTHDTDTIQGRSNTTVFIESEDPVPTASMANVTANERAGTMTLTLRLSHPSHRDITYSTAADGSLFSGTATLAVDYEDFLMTTTSITVPAGRLSATLDITLVDDELEEPDETIIIGWRKLTSSDATPGSFDFTGTITDPPICDAIGNLENATIVKNLRGEITQAGDTNLHKIRLDPYKSYLIEVIGQDGRDMLGVEQHSNLTLQDPEIFAVRNARGGSVLDELATPNNRGHGNNAVAGFKKKEYKSYNIEVGSGNDGTGTYQFKIRLNNVCRLDENDNAHYHWFGGPKGYNPLEIAGDTSTNLSLNIGTHWNTGHVSRSESHGFLGNNWDSDRDQDWFSVDLDQGEEYTIRLRTKTNLPERLQATQLKILAVHLAQGQAIVGSGSEGAAGKKVFVNDWIPAITGRHYIAVGSEGNDRTGMYWVSITKRDTVVYD